MDYGRLFYFTKKYLKKELRTVGRFKILSIFVIKRKILIYGTSTILPELRDAS